MPHFPQGMSHFPQGMSHFPQGMSHFRLRETAQNDRNRDMLDRAELSRERRQRRRALLALR